MSRSARSAVFLDRDGTLIEEREFLSDPEGVTLIPGSAGALVALRDAGFALVIVTNQSGIARGLISEAEFRAVSRRVETLLSAVGASVDGVYHCPHHPGIDIRCDCRKPATGLHRRAARELGLDLAGSYCVGDKVSDVLPAVELGASGILVRTGYGREQEKMRPPQVDVVDDLPAAANLILHREAVHREAT